MAPRNLAALRGGEAETRSDGVSLADLPAELAEVHHQKGDLGELRCCDRQMRRPRPGRTHPLAPPAVFGLVRSARHHLTPLDARSW